MGVHGLKRLIIDNGIKECVLYDFFPCSTDIFQKARFSHYRNISSGRKAIIIRRSIYFILVTKSIRIRNVLTNSYKSLVTISGQQISSIGSSSLICRCTFWAHLYWLSDRPKTHRLSANTWSSFAGSPITHMPENQLPQCSPPSTLPSITMKCCYTRCRRYGRYHRFFVPPLSSLSSLSPLYLKPSGWQVLPTGIWL